MALGQFLAAVLVLELTPGPNMAFLAALSLSRGRRAGLAAALGVTLGLSVHAVLAALGAGAIIERSPNLYELLRWLGVLYLLWLAFEGWRGAAETSPGTVAVLDHEMRRLFTRGLISNIFNPKSILFFTSVVPQFLSTGDPSVTTQLFIYGAIYVAVATTIHVAIVLLAARLQPWLVAGPRRDIARRVLSVALVGIALWLAWATQR